MGYACQVLFGRLRNFFLDKIVPAFYSQDKSLWEIPDNKCTLINPGRTSITTFIFVEVEVCPWVD